MTSSHDILDRVGFEPREEHRGQLRFAERIAREHAERLRYAHGLGWLVWDGMRWAPDKDGAAMRAAVRTVKDAIRSSAELEPDARAELFKDVRKVESSSGLQGVLQIAGSLRPIATAAHMLDGDPWLFNLPTGTLDLRAGHIRPHDPADLITKVSGAGLSNDPAPVFTEFLETVLPDPEVRAFLRRLFGYALVGRVSEHVLPILTGTGRNGKSTLLGVLTQAFGDYALAADPDLLVDRGSSHPTGQADLLGARLAVCSETDEGRALAAATVKRLTGGDRIRARRMRQDFFEFDPSHLAVLVTNHKPKVAGDDPALWRRILVVPFDVVVPPEQVDTKLPEKLSLEMPQVLAWALAGYSEWVERGLCPPDVVRVATEQYRAGSDVLGKFIDERCLIQPNAHVRASDLYAAYKAWCTANGERFANEREFSDQMSARGLQKVHRAVGRVYLDIDLEGQDFGE